MKQKTKIQKGTIQIPLLIAIIVGVVIVSGAGAGVVLHKQGKLSPLVANISQIFKGVEEPITPEPEQVKPEEISQQEQELEQAKLEAEKAKQEAENLRQELEKQKQEKIVQQQPTALSTPTPTTPLPTPTPEPQPTPQSNFSDFTITLNPTYRDWAKKEPKTIYFGGIEPSSYEVNSNIDIEKTSTYRKIVLRKVVAQYIGNMPDSEYYFEIGRINIQGSSFKTERQENLIVWSGYKEINVAQDLNISISFSVINKIGNYMQYQIDRSGLYFYERIEIDTQNVFENQFIEKPIIIKGSFPILSDRLKKL